MMLCMNDVRLPVEIGERARHVIAAEYREREAALVRAVTTLHRDAERQGAADAEATQRRIAALCAQELKLRLLLAWRTLQQTVIEYRPRADDRLAAGLKRELEMYHDRQEGNLRTVFTEAQTGAGGAFDERALALKRDEVERRLFAEVDVFVRSLASGLPQGIVAPAGVLHPDAEQARRLLPALSDLDYQTLRSAVTFALEQLRVAHAVRGAAKADVSELLHEARAELDRTALNQLRLTSLLHGAALALRATPEVRAGYQELRVALLPFGYFLPAPPHGAADDLAPEAHAHAP